jgi:hypothetical protein
LIWAEIKIAAQRVVKSAGKKVDGGGKAVAAGESSFVAELASTQPGRRPFTLMYLQLLKSVGLLWGYNPMNGKK